MQSEYAIAALVPEPFRTQLESLRRQYDRWSKSWLPPHIMIVPPIQDVPQRLIESAAALCYPVDVTFGDWFAFRNPKGQVIWLDPGQTSATEAQVKLLLDYPELVSLVERRRHHGSFTFHITVAGHVPDDTFTKVQRELQRHKIEGTCHIDHLTLYRRELPDGEWQEQK